MASLIRFLSKERELFVHEEKRSSDALIMIY